MTANTKDPCHVCAGTGKPISDIPCVCGGSGTHTDEVLGLRTLVFKYETLIKDYEMALKTLGMSERIIKECRKARNVGV